MSNAARAFEENRGGKVFRSIPGKPAAVDETNLPWSKVRDGDLPPMMFQLRMRDGEIISFAYSDLREIRCRDSGYVQLGILSMNRMRVTLEGRHLRELAGLLGAAMIRWIEEADARDTDRPESSPEVVSITIEAIES